MGLVGLDNGMPRGGLGQGQAATVDFEVIIGIGVGGIGGQSRGVNVGFVGGNGGVALIEVTLNPTTDIEGGDSKDGQDDDDEGEDDFEVAKG